MATVNMNLKHGGVHTKLIISPLLIILDYRTWSHLKARTQPFLFGK